jgi:hypothetical protein
MTQQNDDNFLSRWSKRKLSQPEQSETDAEAQVKRVDEKPEQDKENEEVKPLPIWQQADADPDLKKQALKALFKQSEFGHLDGLNEYDEDYTTFTSLGDVVTREMKRMMDLVEKASSDQASTTAENNSEVAAADNSDAATDEKTEEQEGKDLA